jgi:hypothetical protein
VVADGVLLTYEPATQVDQAIHAATFWALLNLPASQVEQVRSTVADGAFET